jgi:hypothetical protein
MNSERHTFRPSLIGHLRTASRLALPIFCLSAIPAHAVTYFGSLSNFDAVNNTATPCNGFEIELDGLTSRDITYTFDYQSYGHPRLVDSTDVNGKPVVKVRYESKYNPVTHVFLNATPVAPNPTLTTAGHQCVSQPNAHNTSGCEHFGLGIIGNPTKTIYRWLVADPATPGNLTYQLDPATSLPGTVSIPAPIFAVNALPVQIPAPPQAQAGNPPPAPVAVPPQPVVVPVIEAPEPPPSPPESKIEFGDALWVKVYTTESPNPRDLVDLVTDNPKVPDPNALIHADPVETEVEWMLVQKDLKKANNVRNKVEGNANKAEMAANHESVTRRYEFYEFGGGLDPNADYDPESHEALPVSGKDDLPTECTAATEASCDLGKYIGAQMVAMNVFDADSDGKDDVADNCLLKPNLNQRDTDGDGFGNLCDPDFNGDFVVDNADLNTMKGQFLKKNPDPNVDLNGDGKVNFNDLAILKTFMGKAPGPKAAELPR